MGPFGVRRIADEGKQVRLEARHPTAGAHKRHHLADDSLGLGHIDKDRSHMGAVERCTRQPRVVCIALAHPDLR